MLQRFSRCKYDTVTPRWQRLATPAFAGSGRRWFVRPRFANLWTDPLDERQLYGIADRGTFCVDTFAGKSNVIWKYASAGWGNGGGATGSQKASNACSAGDYQFDGDVSEADLAAWQAAFSDSISFLAADESFKRLIDSSDFLIWQWAQCITAAETDGSSIPDPGTVGIALLCLYLMFGRFSYSIRHLA
ncbi:MAG: hypothetical protein CMJ58_25725 [Planctomycetaceae bacterium]|nr:hypothetical protein [Planctomycetaceae bacterium]